MTQQSAAQQGKAFLEKHSDYRLVLCTTGEATPQLILTHDTGYDEFTRLLDLDMSNVYEQVGSWLMRNQPEWLNPQPQQPQSQLYTLEFLDGEKITGTPADIACRYCSHEGIKLFIDDIPDEGLQIDALFPGAKACTYIACFEDGDTNDLETAYRLFFTEYLNDRPEGAKWRVYTAHE